MTALLMRWETGDSELNECIDRILAGDSAEEILKEPTLSPSRELEPLMRMKTVVVLENSMSPEPPSEARKRDGEGTSSESTGMERQFPALTIA